MNLKGIGLKQLHVIFEMGKRGLVVRRVHDHRDGSVEISLQDEEGDNIYESVPDRILASLYERSLLKMSSFSPCLQISVDVFRLRSEVLDAWNIELAAEVCDATMLNSNSKS